MEKPPGKRSLLGSGLSIAIVCAYASVFAAGVAAAVYAPSKSTSVRPSLSMVPPPAPEPGAPSPIDVIGAPSLLPVIAMVPRPAIRAALPPASEAQKLLHAAKKVDEPVLGWRVDSVDEAIDVFKQHQYTLDGIRLGAPVPRLYLVHIPADIRQVTSLETRRQFFMRALLPLMLKINERIQAQRAFVIYARNKVANGRALSLDEQSQLAKLAAYYKVKGAKFDELLDRVDIIPPSLALAQAITESGWGTSAFAVRGNALFGQITAETWGMTPIAPIWDGKGEPPFRIKAFPALSHTFEEYARNLNTMPQYKAMREARANLRRADIRIDGYILAGQLHAYSERGEAYIAYIRNLMSNDELLQFDLDNVRLAPPDMATNDSPRL
ncbi:MAG: glucosaminidase domain-containing protein [Alphaproteobacteria bacterium]